VLILRLLIGLTDQSLVFCVALGKAGYLRICIEELKLIRTKKSDEVSVNKWHGFSVSLSIALAQFDSVQYPDSGNET